jgi:glucose/mannose transport system permease protein
MQVSAHQPPGPVARFTASIRRLNRDRVYAFLVLLPSIVLLAIFVYGFIGQTFLWSLTDWAGLSATREKNYVGFENYDKLFSEFDGFRFRTELVNTFFFTIIFLTGCLVLGFILAVVLDQNVTGENFFRTVFLFPFALSFAVTGTVWRWLLNPKGGINLLPKLVGAKAWTNPWLNTREKYTFNWHEVPTLTLVIVIGVTLWILVRAIRGRRFLTLFYLGIPVVLLYAWMLSDWLTWDSENPHMNGVFNWQNVPRYVTAAILVGFLLFVVQLLGQGSRRAAAITAIPAAVLFWWYVSNGPDRFPNVSFPEDFGFNIALIGILIPSIWQLSGYTMAIYLAGIRGIPEELREAARVDGCTEWQVYMRIILPMLRPVTLSAAIVLGHISLKVFDLIFAMVGTDYMPVSVPGVQVYTRMFRGNRFAVGSAIAMILLVMVASVIVPYLVTTLRSEHEL